MATQAVWPVHTCDFCQQSSNPRPLGFPGMGQEGGGGRTATVSFLSGLLDQEALGRSRKSSLSLKELFDQC